MENQTQGFQLYEFSPATTYSIETGPYSTTISQEPDLESTGYLTEDTQQTNYVEDVSVPDLSGNSAYLDDVAGLSSPSTDCVRFSRKVKKSAHFENKCDQHPRLESRISTNIDRGNFEIVYS
jgi:hypothetical protein